MSRFQSDYHNYFPGDGKVTSKDIIPHVPRIYVVKFRELYIRLSAQREWKRVGVTFPPYFRFSPGERKTSAFGSTTSLSVKFDAEIQDAKGSCAPFMALWARKTGAVQDSSSSIDRTLSVSCVYTFPRGQSRYRATPRTHLASVRSPSVVFVHIENITRFLLPPLSCIRRRWRIQFRSGYLEDIVLKQKSVPREL